LADFHQFHPSKPAIHEADLVLMVGCRLDNQMNFGNPPFIQPETKLVCVNGSHEELDYNVGADLQLLSDPGAFLTALAQVDKTFDGWLNLQRKRRADWVSEWSAHIATETAQDAVKGRKMHPLQLALDVQAAMKDDDWLVFDGGNTHFWNEIATNIAAARGRKLGGILHPGNYSLLGVGVSFALSAKNLNRDKTVVLVTGDGAFLSGGLSIEACFQENIPIVVVVDNNGGLDCISQQQERLFKNQQHYATDFRDIPFHGLFEGLGGYGELVTKRADLPAALERAMASGMPACLNVKCRGVISPIVAATSDKRDKASIE
jgi:acetolactate synthase-1/2/3 large subunit